MLWKFGLFSSFSTTTTAGGRYLPDVSVSIILFTNSLYSLVAPGYGAGPLSSLF